jgi:hypothetical protein
MRFTIKRLLVCVAAVAILLAMSRFVEFHGTCNVCGLSLFAERLGPRDEYPRGLWFFEIYTTKEITRDRSWSAVRLTPWHFSLWENWSQGSPLVYVSFSRDFTSPPPPE